jgi:hypothetical protein
MLGSPCGWSTDCDSCGQRLPSAGHTMGRCGSWPVIAFAPWLLVLAPSNSSKRRMYSCTGGSTGRRRSFGMTEGSSGNGRSTDCDCCGQLLPSGGKTMGCCGFASWPLVLAPSNCSKLRMYSRTGGSRSFCMTEGISGTMCTVGSVQRF